MISATMLIGRGVTRLPAHRGLQAAIAWHEQRIAAIAAQLQRRAVQMGDPRRAVDLRLSLEHHQRTLAQLRQNLEPTPHREPPLTRSRRSFAERQAARHDAVLQEAWRQQLDDVKVALRVA